MEHGLAYEALARGQIDLIDAYSTDGKLRRYDVVVLEDDLGFFPPYHAAPLVRREALLRHPSLRDVLWRLAFRIDDATAMELNYRVEVGGEAFADVARSFLAARGLGPGAPPDATASPGLPRNQRGVLASLWSARQRLLSLLLEHLGLVAVAVAFAALLAVPLGIAVRGAPTLRGLLLGGAAVLQTIPSLALLAFLIAVPWLGLGARSAVVALVLYAVLPILRNTCTGLDGVDPELVEVAKGLGLTPRQVMLRVRLPLAIRTILAGVRTAAVITVGIATLAAFIGAGGLGQPIVEGLYLNDTALVLCGAVPAALLALAVDGVLGLLERALTPRGLRAAAG
jgi:osmoprotectant transport system permease protein